MNSFVVGLCLVSLQSQVITVSLWVSIFTEMWRQLGKQLERFLQRGSVPTAKAVAQNNSEAHNALREAVRDLSKGQSLPLTRKPTPVLLDWNSKKVDELETEQLEELARIHFEGDGVNFEKSPSKALSFWEEAAKRGSIDARYSKAVCYRDGVGTKKDVERGFVEMLQLAKDENYHLANVRISRFPFILL